MSLAKDLGLHVKRIGFKPTESIFIIALKVRIIIKYADDHFSFPAPVGTDEDTYLGSFDFDLETAMQLHPILGDIQFAKLMQPTKGVTIQFHFNEETELNVRVSLPTKEELVENDKEIYLPLKVNEFVRL